ncbi:MAG: GIY-YIG nuclease family protein [Bacteroidales bacterium]|nr:GIY-YIG nuclease family protein [Bacteroidales bacterium]
MNSHCYILFSAKLKKLYVGATQDDVEQRLIKHNEQAYGKQSYTAVASDWEIFLKIPANDFAHAVRMERKIKLMKSSKYIRNLKQYPELVN